MLDLKPYKNTVRAFETALEELAAFARELIARDDPLASKAISGYEQVSDNLRAADARRRASHAPYAPIDTSHDTLRVIDRRLRRSIRLAITHRAEEKEAARAAAAASARAAELANLTEQVAALEGALALQQELQRRKEAADAHLTHSLNAFHAHRHAAAARAAATASARNRTASAYIKANNRVEALRQRAQEALHPTTQPTMSQIIAGLLANHKG